jgi:hypothetical protein
MAQVFIQPMMTQLKLKEIRSIIKMGGIFNKRIHFERGPGSFEKGDVFVTEKGNWKFLWKLNEITKIVEAPLWFVHTRAVDLAILLSDVISLEILPSFQIATAGESDNV